MHTYVYNINRGRYYIKLFVICYVVCKNISSEFEHFEESAAIWNNQNIVFTPPVFFLIAYICIYEKLKIQS